MKYEYTWFPFDGDLSQVNRLAHMGWKVISVVPVALAPTGQSIYTLMERSTPNGSQPELMSGSTKLAVFVWVMVFLGSALYWLVAENGGIS